MLLSPLRSTDFYLPGALVKDMTASAPQLQEQQIETAVIVHVGTNDIHHKCMEEFKKDFVCLVDKLLFFW